MKRLVITAAIFALAGSAVLAAVSGTPHDFSQGSGTLTGTTTTETCVFCHTPHQAGTSVDPLWNQTVSTNATYGVYDSVSFNGSGTISDIGGGSSYSLLCMSCHDNTVAVGTVYNAPRVGVVGTPALMSDINAAANVGTDLSNDHPINFTYDGTLATADGGLVTPASTDEVVTGVPLFGGLMQCATCHDPHDNTASPFLVVSNNNSDLCTTCHNK